MSEQSVIVWDLETVPDLAAGARALFELHFDGDDVSIVQERHYRLTECKDISQKELQTYRKDKS